ncbi:hypothetical protein JW968_00060 [Candidatus Woesearchaeota archaeon]|nr:hypothetical protein [Candidatus Woesearchaeota archaeon]
MTEKYIWRCGHCGLEVNSETLPEGIRKKHKDCRFRRYKVRKEHNPLENVLDYLHEHEKELEHKHSADSCNCDD